LLVFRVIGAGNQADIEENTRQLFADPMLQRTMIMENRWYYQLFMEEFGPVSESMVRQLLEDGTLGSGDLIRAENSADWVPAETLAADESEPNEISDLSELSFDFEESAHQDRQSKAAPVSPPQLEAPLEFYTQSLGQILGPMSMTDLIGMAESGALSGADGVRSGELGQWVLASSVAGLKAALHLGENIVSEPIASAPPSTRRLFQTAGRPADANSATLDSSTDPSENEVENPTPAAARLAAEPVASKPASEPAAVAEASESRPALESDSRLAVKKGKKKKNKNQEDDKLLDDIFDDVFSDNQKSPRGSMPGMPSSGMASSSGSSSGPSSSANTAGPSANRSAASADLKPAAAETGASPAAAPATPSPMMAPVMRSPTPSAPAAYRPAPTKSGSGFSFDGPIRNIAIGLVGIILCGLIWKVGIPLFTGVNTGQYSSRTITFLADFKALGEEPQAGPWQELTTKSRVEFMTYYKAMLEAGATGPENVACMEGLKNVIALCSTRIDDKEKRKETLGRLEKAVAGLGK
jgi:hypothetical protein